AEPRGPEAEEGLRQEGETKLARLVRETLDRNAGKVPAEDNEAARQTCRQYHIPADRARAIAREVRQQWEKDPAGEVNVSGCWEARPADDPGAEWVRVCYPPGQVRLRPGEVHRLKVDTRVTDAELAGLARLREITSLRWLILERCSQVTDAGLAHL